MAGGRTGACAGDGLGGTGVAARGKPGKGQAAGVMGELGVLVGGTRRHGEAELVDDHFAVVGGDLHPGRGGCR